MTPDDRPRLRKPPAAAPVTPPPADPKPKLPHPNTLVQQPPKPHPIDRLIGQRIVLQGTQGFVQIEGEFIARRDNLLTLERALIRGARQVAEMEVLILYCTPNHIAHIHTMPTKLEARPRPQEEPSIEVG